SAESLVVGGRRLLTTAQDGLHWNLAPLVSKVRFRVAWRDVESGAIDGAGRPVDRVALWLGRQFPPPAPPERSLLTKFRASLAGRSTGRSSVRGWNEDGIW